MKNLKEKMKNTKGITLVALVVTIIVLLILAAVSLSTVFSQDGIFNRASKSAIITEIAKVEETAQMIYSEKTMDNAESNRGSQVETSEIIVELQNLGNHIEKRPVKEVDIEGISLDKENITMGKNTTVEIKVTYLGVNDPFIYYVEVQGEYYQMHSNKGFITIDREPSELTKADFETGGSTVTLTVASSEESVATATLKSGSNHIIEITSKEVTKETEVIITVNYGKHRKACTVKVVVPVLATGITLNETEYVVTGGQSWINNLQLVATLEPNNVTEKEVTWTSSNPEIATVDNTGLVKAGTKGGDVTITATTKDGTNLSKTCKITTELFGKTNAAKTPYTDSDGNTAQIPDGYAVGTSDNVNKVTGGLVAQDKEGNQFVWIPVGEVKKSNIPDFTVTLGRYAFVKDQPIPATPAQTQANYSETVNIKGYMNRNFQESISQEGNNAHAKKLKSFIDNAIADGGYWLGRYEASNDSGTKSKYNKVPFVTVTQPQSSSYAQGMKNSGAYQSDLVNSYAWDTAIVFIEKSGNTGYASKSSVNTNEVNTGKSGDKVCNIYDMASNCLEWNTEAVTDANYRYAFRGGSYNYSNCYTSYRSSSILEGVGLSCSFRCVLYRP